MNGEQIEVADGRLRVAMLGTTDGGFIDPDSHVPAGEMYRLAAEAVGPLLAEAEARGASRATDRIAERLWVEARRHDARQVGFSAIGDACAGAALIAEQMGDDRG